MLRECRKSAKVDIDTALSNLGVAERTLRGYEADDDAPHDIVNRAAELYNAPLLRHWKCSKCPLGHIHPAVKEEDLYADLLRITRTATRAKEDCFALADILEDGKITPDEVGPAEEIKSRFQKLIKLGTQLLANFDMTMEKHSPRRQTERCV